MFRIRSLVVLTFALLAPNVQEYISYIAKYAYLNHIVHFQNITSLSSTCCEICLNNFRERFCCGGEWEWKGHRPDDRAPEECRWQALKRKKKSGLIMKRPTWTGSNILCLSGELAANGGFLSASSLPNRYLHSTSKSSAQTVIKLSGIGLCRGSWGTPSWSYTSAWGCLKVLVSTG